MATMAINRRMRMYSPKVCPLLFILLTAQWMNEGNPFLNSFIALFLSLAKWQNCRLSIFTISMRSLSSKKWVWLHPFRRHYRAPAIWLRTLLICVPKSVTATIATTAIKMRIKAYSESVWPFSLLMKLRKKLMSNMITSYPSKLKLNVKTKIIQQKWQTRLSSPPF